MSTLEELVGENKKYRTADDLARGKVAADEHIQRVESENASLRDKVKEYEMQGDIFSRLKDELQPKPEVVSNRQETPVEPETPVEQPSEPKELSIEEQVANAVRAIKNEETSEKNLRDSAELFRKTYGDKATEEFTNRLNALGVDAKFANDIAAKSPSAFARLMGIQSADQQGTIPQRTPNTNNFTPTGRQLTGIEAAIAKRKEIGDHQYWSPKVQGEIHRQALADPDNFFKRGN